jgi:hypothetical protein
MACDPIFGIVTRAAGPTWCEEDTQATVQGYCNDFDRADGAATTSELAATVNATLAVTDKVASSPPNSLSVTSGAIAADAGVLAGYLVSFGQPNPSSALPPFTCQVDLLTSDLVAAADAGATVGVLAVGGQSVNCTEEPVMALISFGPSDTGPRISVSLQENPGPMVPAVPLGVPVLVPLPPGAVPTGAWMTLEVAVAQNGFHDASVGGGIRGTLGNDDAGQPQGMCGADGGAAPGGYVVALRIGPIDLGAVRLPDEGFVQPVVTFGEFLQGPGPPLTVHLDNVRCTLASAP